VYEFTSDAVWNRILFGQKDVYINEFFNAGTGTLAIASPGGLDISGSRTLYVADRQNNRVLAARFDASTRSLQQRATMSDAALLGVVDVAWDGSSSPLTDEYFYTLSGSGWVAYWALSGSSATLLWTYGQEGTLQGQFRWPHGICVGRAAAGNGGSVHTTDFYVADAGNRRLVWLRRSTDGGSWMSAVQLPDNGVPTDCTVDHFGNVIAVDTLNSRLVKYTWNLTYLDRYGVYGVGALNHNTFARPHAVHAPFGAKRNASGQTIWYGEGRIITAERWGPESGAREHYLGMDGAITAQPQTDQFGDAWFSFRTTDHGYHTFTVFDVSGNTVRRVPPMGIFPPGTRTWLWDGLRDDGTPAPNGTYWMQVTANSPYGCSGQSWCQKGFSTQTFFHQAGSGCGSGPCAPPVAGDVNDSASAPSTLLLRQRVVGAPTPLTRLSGPTDQTGAVTATSSGSLTAAVRQYGVRGLSIGVPRDAAGEPVSIRVYSLAGRPMRTLVNETLQPGYYELAWDGMDDRGQAAAPGVYFAVLTVGGRRVVQRLILR
jgi:flagellar hook assembly protein FlgD